MGFTTGTGTSNPSGTHEFIPSVHGVCVDLSNVFFSVICWSFFFSFWSRYVCPLIYGVWLCLWYLSSLPALKHVFHYTRYYWGYVPLIKFLTIKALIVKLSSISLKSHVQVNATSWPVAAWRISRNFIEDHASDQKSWPLPINNNGDSRFFIIFVLLNKTTVPRNVPLLVQELFVLKKTWVHSLFLVGLVVVKCLSLCHLFF